MEDTTLSRQRSEKHIDQRDMASFAFASRDNLFVSFNETTWWVFDKGTMTGVCVPMRGKGTAETCEEESETCSASEGCCWGEKTPPAATGGWLAGCAAPPMEREKSATVVESMEEK